MIKEIEKSLQKYLKENDINVQISQPASGEFVSVIALDRYKKDKKAMDNNYPVDTYTFLLHVVANTHEEMVDILKRYSAIKEPLMKAFVVYDFSTGTAVQDVECTISMPNEVMFNAPFGTTFMDDIIITYRRL